MSVQAVGFVMSSRILRPRGVELAVIFLARSMRWGKGMIGVFRNEP